jgi:hypothetical protein
MPKMKEFLPIIQRIMFLFFFLIGAVFLLLSALAEHRISSRTSYFGVDRSAEMCFQMSDLQQTISAGNTKIFAGLCMVAAAIVFTTWAGRVGAEARPIERDHTSRGE